MKFKYLILFLLIIAGCTTVNENQVDVIDDEKTESTTVEPEIQPEPEVPTETAEESEEIEEPEITEPVKEIKEQGFTLTAEKVENSVVLQWSKYTGEFTQYKVISSITNANPTYPGETLLKTIPFVNETTYIDTKPEGGISYYAVAAIGPLNEKTHTNIIRVEFPNPKETPDQEIILTATKTENGVVLEWDRYEGEFLFYKVVRTIDHPYPKYPDDSTIKTIAYVNETSFTDINPEIGINYYAVTIVRPDKSRFTSSRDSVESI